MRHSKTIITIISIVIITILELVVRQLRRKDQRYIEQLTLI